MVVVLLGGQRSKVKNPSHVEVGKGEIWLEHDGGSCVVSIRVAWNHSNTEEDRGWNREERVWLFCRFLVPASGGSVVVFGNVVVYASMPIQLAHRYHA